MSLCRYGAWIYRGLPATELQLLSDFPEARHRGDTGGRGCICCAREVEYWIAQCGLLVLVGGARTDVTRASPHVHPHPMTHTHESTSLTPLLRMVVGLCRQEEGMICPIPLSCISYLPTYDCICWPIFSCLLGGPDVTVTTQSVRPVGHAWLSLVFWLCWL